MNRDPKILKAATNDERTRPRYLLNCVQGGKSRVYNGLKISSILPDVGRKFGIFGRKSKSDCVIDKMRGRDRQGPLSTSSGLYLNRQEADTRAAGRQHKSDKKTRKLYRSQSVREYTSYSGKPAKTRRSPSTGSLDMKQQINQRDGYRRRSACSVDDVMLTEFGISSNIVEMSNKLLMPGYLNDVITDLNNNNDKDAVAMAIARLSSNQRRLDAGEEDTDTKKNKTTSNEKRNEEHSNRKGRGRDRSHETDRKLTAGKNTTETNVDQYTAAVTTRSESSCETKTDDGENKPSDERERLEELKEAQERLTRLQASRPNRSRTKDGIQKGGPAQDVNWERNSVGSKRECRNTVDIRRDRGPQEDLAANSPEMIARATKAFQEHVKDVTEKTRASCCIGKPATARKECANNQYNTRFHGGMKEANFNHHPITNNNLNHNGQETKHDLPEYTYAAPPPPYHIEQNAHQLDYNPQQAEHGLHQPRPSQDHSEHNHHPDHNPHHPDHNPQHPDHSPHHPDHNPHHPEPNPHHLEPNPHQHRSELPRGRSPSPHKSCHGSNPEEMRTTSTATSQHQRNASKTNGVVQSQERCQYIINEATGTTYVKGRLLGKGGFAKCYELTDVKTKKIYAGKIISKSRLTKPHQKEKILREIELHKSLKHRHVVAFHSYFEDNDNVYIILECCSMKSLVHVLKCRKSLTEPEVRYFMTHLIEGCRYIHQQRVIHRDLKLGNMLLNDKMMTKIADFGLATRVEYEGEKKMTVCGTPNYIAPEVLQKKGHSYEADIWAMGCIMYAMLVGKPPFETSTLKETYVRITANKYSIPTHVSRAARNLINKLLAPDPQNRPSLDKILADEFFTSGHLPRSLPISCCETPPKFPMTSSSSASSNTSIPSRPQSYAAPVSTPEAIQNIQTSLAQLKHTRKAVSQIITKREKGSCSLKEPGMKQASSAPNGVKRSTSAELRNVPSGSAIRLYQMLTTCLEQMPSDGNPTPVDTAKQPWVTKWVDYSNKYGFGFQLSDKSVGILFNDTTRILLANDGKTCQYNDLSNKVYTFCTDTAPEEYQKKVTLLLYFAQYMDQHLIHGGDLIQSNRQDQCSPSGIFMKKWFRTGKAIVMYLNNGTLQVNFFEDHTKVILSPEGQDYNVTYINSKRISVSYHLLQLRHFGCHPDIQERLRYSRRMLESIINIEGEAV